jgi:SAM-dependent methyltransferase
MIYLGKGDTMSWLRRVFFNFMYYRKPPWDTGISPPELIAHIQSNPPGKALDLGCGTGTNVITLAKNGWQVTGVDFAPHAITLARQKIQHAGVQADLLVGDVTQLDNVSGPFNLILDLGCFHSLGQEERKAYLKNIQRLLAVQGVYLLYAFFALSEGGRPGITQADVEAITSLFKLEARQDGSDRGRGRPSAWFTLRNANGGG